MKKLLLLAALFIGFSVQSKAQANLYDSLKNDLTAIVKTLEGPTKQVYELHKKEVVISAWVEIAVPTFILLVCIISAVITNKKSDVNSDWDGPTVFFIFASIVVFIITIICVADGMTDLMNVDYHAMKMLVNNIRG